LFLKPGFGRPSATNGPDGFEANQNFGPQKFGANPPRKHLPNLVTNFVDPLARMAFGNQMFLKFAKLGRTNRGRWPIPKKFHQMAHNATPTCDGRSGWIFGLDVEHEPGTKFGNLDGIQPDFGLGFLDSKNSSDQKVVFDLGFGRGFFVGGFPRSKVVALTLKIQIVTGRLFVDQKPGKRGHCG
jgi:hypothetical protein